MTEQTLLEEWADIVFDCPFCGKEIHLKQNEKSVFHRNWTFHFAYEHMNSVYENRQLRSCMELFLVYYMVHNEPVGRELRNLLFKSKRINSTLRR